MRIRNEIIIAIVIGAAITALSTHLYGVNVPAGVTLQGFPFTALGNGCMLTTTNQPCPTTYDWVGMFLDILIWSVVAFLIIHFGSVIAKKKR